ERVLFHPAGDADDREPRRRGRGVPRPNPFAYRILVRPELGGHAFVHDRNAKSVGAIVGTELAASDERDAERLEVPSAHRSLIAVDEASSGWRNAPFERDRTPREEAGERKRRDPARRSHAGQSIDLPPEPPIRAADGFGSCVLAARHHELERQHTAPIEAR